MLGPRFTGAPQGSSILARCDTQMSVPPNPPGRSELTYRLRPSLEIAGCCSFAAELTTGPRFTGEPQGPYAGWSSPAASAARGFAASGPTRRSSGLHAYAKTPSAYSRVTLSIGFIAHLAELIAPARIRRYLLAGRSQFAPDASPGRNRSVTDGGDGCRSASDEGASHDRVPSARDSAPHRRRGTRGQEPSNAFPAPGAPGISRRRHPTRAAPPRHPARAVLAGA